MGKVKNFISKLHNSTKRDYISRMVDNKVYCMKIAKKGGANIIDFGVSHLPETDSPLSPKFSLIKFKEQFGAFSIIRTGYEKEL